MVGNGQARIFEHDCVPAVTFALAGGGNGGPPTIADYDTDGAPEIGIADAFTYTVYEANGDILWSQEVDDESSSATGSVVFDFEGDGRPEVVYADETRLWIFAGADGEVRLSDTGTRVEPYMNTPQWRMWMAMVRLKSLFPTVVGTSMRTGMAFMCWVPVKGLGDESPGVESTRIFADQC